MSSVAVNNKYSNPKNFREICVAKFEYCVWRLETRWVPAGPGPAGTGASAKLHAQYSN